MASVNNFEKRLRETSEYLRIGNAIKRLLQCALDIGSYNAVTLSYLYKLLQNYLNLVFSLVKEELPGCEALIHVCAAIMEVVAHPLVNRCFTSTPKENFEKWEAEIRKIKHKFCHEKSDATIERLNSQIIQLVDDIQFEEGVKNNVVLSMEKMSKEIFKGYVPEEWRKILILGDKIFPKVFQVNGCKTSVLVRDCALRLVELLAFKAAEARSATAESIETNPKQVNVEPVVRQPVPKKERLEHAVAFLKKELENIKKARDELYTMYEELGLLINLACMNQRSILMILKKF